jgi:hypothetical protein
MRLRLRLAAVAILVVLNVVLIVALLTRGHTPTGPSSSGQAGDAPSSSTPSSNALSSDVASPSPRLTAPGRKPLRIELTAASYVGARSETVPINGIAHGTHTATTLRVQHRQGGRWVAFPLPATTDATGRFTAYVDLGAPGTYDLRVVDPRTGRTSDVVTLVIG